MARDADTAQERNPRLGCIPDDMLLHERIEELGTPANYRSFETTEDYRTWCEENLPEWLGYVRI